MILIKVVAGQSVTVRAMSFVRVPRRKRLSFTIKKVCSVGYGFQVQWVDTPAIVASVVNLMAVRDLSRKVLIRKTMRSLPESRIPSAINLELTVAVWPPAALPLPARRQRRPVCSYALRTYQYLFQKTTNRGVRRFWRVLSNCQAVSVYHNFPFGGL